MTELKTLKDLDQLIIKVNYDDWECLPKTNDDNFVLIKRKAISGIKEVLKLEAIKWIKELIEDGDKDESEFSADGYTSNVIKWIKHFFDITDEELK